VIVKCVALPLVPREWRCDLWALAVVPDAERWYATRDFSKPQGDW
jgi:hypothetical protein